VLDWRDQDALARMGAARRRAWPCSRPWSTLPSTTQTTPRVVELHVTLSAEATARDHPVHDYFVRRYAWLLELVAAAFEHAAAHGQLQPGIDCPQRGVTLVALMDGLQGLWLLDRGRWTWPRSCAATCARW
jgi:hypothetical protein